MTIGTVKWFNPEKGYGFITPDNGKEDAFIHLNTLRDAGIETLSPGQKVSFDLIEDRDKVSAGNIKLLSS